MRVPIVTAGLLALMLAAWPADAAAPTPLQCSAAHSQSHAILFSAGRSDVAGYTTYCGPGRAAVQLKGKSFTFKGGHCTSTRWRFGVMFWNGTGKPPPAKGFVLIMLRAKRPGRNAIIDSAFQLPGVKAFDPTATGTAVVAKSLKSATFSLVTGTSKITGNLSCG